MSDQQTLELLTSIDQSLKDLVAIARAKKPNSGQRPPPPQRPQASDPCKTCSRKDECQSKCDVKDAYLLNKESTR